MNRIEKIKSNLLDGLRPYDEDIEYLLRIAEMAIMTRNMLKACIGRPVDDTATIFLDKVLEENCD